MKIARFNYHWLCLIGCLFINNFSLHANHYYFKQLSLKDGFPAYVKCVLTEEKGFVWIGGPSGLGRFDGYELKQYVYHPDNAHSLPHNNIHQIIEDKQHNIWVLTEGGVARYQPLSDDFYIPKTPDGHPIIAQSVCLVPEGVVFGCRNKIIKYNYQSRSIAKPLKFITEDYFIVTSMIPWDKETLLCSSRWKGALLVNVRTGNATSPPFKCENDITDILIDTKEFIWTASYSNGIRCFARNGNLLASYNTQNSKLSNNIVLSIIERDSRIWIGTDGGGINILDPGTKEITVLEHIPGDSYSLPVNSIRCLYNDGENMWVGTIRGGLINIREVSMTTYKDTPLGNTGGLSENTVVSIYEESVDKIWIGTDGGGVNLFNPITKKFKHFPTTWGDKVVSITNFSKDELLISIFTKGLFVFNKVTGTSRRLVIINEAINKQLVLSGRTINVHRNSPETFLLLDNHIYLYNKTSRLFSVVDESEDLELVGPFILIHSTPENTYLSGLHHIYRINHHTNKIESLYSCATDTVISSVASDEQGRFWIGDNHGLGSYNPVTRKKERIQTTLFSNIKSVVCDRKGKLWIGANGMVFAWLMKERKFIPFGETDGVILNEYINRSRLLSASGDVYLGGINGLLQIDKNTTVEASENASLQLIDIKINSEPVKLQQKDRVERISIPWDTQMFAIRVMPYGHDIFRKRMYRFQIAGLNNQHIDSYHPELIIRSLPSGTYQIMVSYNTRTGDWTSPQQILTLIVMPPWYKAWWFILCLGLILSGGIVLVVFFTLRRKENKLKWAMKEHEQQVYEEKVRFLINISHELRTPLTLIHGPLNRMLKLLPADNSHYASLRRVYKQAQRMKDLINMVLDVRKIEVGGSKLMLRMQELNPWVEQVALQFAEEAEASGIRLAFLPDGRIERVSFDADKCEIILTNLLINALKHSPQGSEISISTTMVVEERRVRIAVSDQGNGLKDIDTQLLFTRFYQGMSERGGTGIGLSYSKILVELHGGLIGVTDNQEKGATFFFELPLRMEETELFCQPKAYLNELMADTSEKKESSSDNSFIANHHSILLVDDNEDLITFLKESFEGKFGNIITAKDGEEAIALATQHCPDIIVSDIMMPRKNGYELCREVKQNIEISHIPVVLLTARGDLPSEMQGYNNGADAYLSKPFEIDVLWELICSQLRNRVLVKSYYQQTGPLPKPECSTISQADEAFLLKLNQIIAENMDKETIDIDFLCREIGMSRTSFYKKLKALTDISPNDYINKLKMEKAILLITTTDLPFTEIAELTGFTTSRYFSTAFKLYTKKTPTQYKKMSELKSRL